MAEDNIGKTFCRNPSLNTLTYRILSYIIRYS